MSSEIKKPVHIGMPNDRTGGVNNSFVRHNAAIRQQLGSVQESQALTINGAMPDTIDNGISADQGESTWFVSSQTDCVVLAVIPRFPNVNQINHVSFNNHTTVFVQRLLEDGQQGEVDVIELPYFHRKHPYGFTYEETELRETLRAGDIIKAEQPILRSPNVSECGEYGTGLNLEMAFLSRHEATEDSSLAWEGIKDLTIAHRFDNVVIPCTSSEWLSNIFGNDDTYQPCPGIGEYVRDDGLLCGHFKVDPVNSPLQVNKFNLPDPREYYDYPKWTALGSMVVDIKVRKNKAPVKASRIPASLRRYLDHFVSLDDNYHTRLLETYRDLGKSGCVFTGKATSLAADWRIALEGGVAVKTMAHGKTSNTKYRTSFRKIPCEEYLLEITTRAEVRINIGAKMTDKNGSKFTVGMFVHEKHMPHDKWGRFAKIVVSNEHSVDRNTIGQPWEAWYKDVQWHAARLIREAYKAGKTMLELKEMTLDFARRISDDTEYLLQLENLRRNGLEDFIRCILDGGDFDFYIPIDAGDLGFPAFAKVMGSPLDIAPDHLTWESFYTGRAIKTKAKGTLGIKYFWVLEKDGRYLGASHSPLKQSSGITAKIKPWEKKNSQVSKSSYKIIGEPDTKNLQANNGERNTSILLTVLSNPELHEEKMYTRINAADPAKIKEQVDYSKLGDLSNQGVRQFKHYLEVHGAELTND